MKIIHEDLEHVLMDSETRGGTIAHTLEKVDGAWTCTCEWSHEGGHKDCKHRKYMRKIERQRKIIRDLSPSFRKSNENSSLHLRELPAK